MRDITTEQEIANLKEYINQLTSKNNKLLQWIRDLQNMGWVTCVYCGHRYGPRDKTPTALSDSLKEHIEHCPEHPMSKLKEENEKLKTEINRLKTESLLVFEEAKPKIEWD